MPLAHAQQMSLTAGRKQQNMRHTYRARATGSSRRNGERRLGKVARWSGRRPSAFNQQSITYVPARRSAPLSPGGCRTTGHFPLCAPWLRQQCPLHSSISAALPCANGTALHDARRSAHRVCARAPAAAAGLAEHTLWRARSPSGDRGQAHFRKTGLNVAVARLPDPIWPRRVLCKPVQVPTRTHPCMWKQAAQTHQELCCFREPQGARPVPKPKLEGISMPPDTCLDRPRQLTKVTKKRRCHEEMIRGDHKGPRVPQCS